VRGDFRAEPGRDSGCGPSTLDASNASNRVRNVPVAIVPNQETLSPIQMSPSRKMGEYPSSETYIWRTLLVMGNLSLSGAGHDAPGQVYLVPLEPEDNGGTTAGVEAQKDEPSEVAFFSPL
jgi:hypothetical protein